MLFLHFARLRALHRAARHVPGEQTDHADDDQVKGDDVVEKPRHEQDQDAGDECDERCHCYAHEHKALLFKGVGRIYRQKNDLSYIEARWALEAPFFKAPRILYIDTALPPRSLSDRAARHCGRPAGSPQYVAVIRA